MCVFQVWSRGRYCSSVKPLAGAKAAPLYFRLCCFYISSVTITGRAQEWQYLPLEALLKVFLWISSSQAWLRSCHSPLHSVFPHYIVVILPWGSYTQLDLSSLNLSIFIKPLVLPVISKNNHQKKQRKI